ncbi:hypothetical protein [Frankia sp. AgB32]|uniref:hypothetical protein n=1 Tax=Frankia sp. AgB32 TaxID=631119 RepID=UPI00200F4273|nr:hypothetical protein [Frankia sp. AgB32]MCK9896953.1 hypothetical protein [Frankia sp. AgB32]
MAVPALCSAITLKGTRCKNRAKHGSVCGVHEKTRKKLAELAASAKPRSKKTSLTAPAQARSTSKATPKSAHVGKGTHLGALPLADNGSNLAWKGNATADGKFSVEKQNGRWHALDHRTRKAGIKMTGGGVKTKAEAVRHVTEFTAMRGTSDAALMRNARSRADAAQTAARRAAVNEATGRIGDSQVAAKQRVAAIGARAAFRAADEQITETNAALAALPAGHRLATLLDAHREHLTKQRERHRADAGHHDLQADFDVYGKRRAGHTPASRALMAAERAGVPAVPPGA